MNVSNAKNSRVKPTEDPDERFEWDMTTVLIIALVILFVALVIVAVGLERR